MWRNMEQSASSSSSSHANSNTHANSTSNSIMDSIQNIFAIEESGGYMDPFRKETNENTLFSHNLMAG